MDNSQQDLAAAMQGKAIPIEIPKKPEPLLVVVRLKIDADEKDRREVEEVVARERKKLGVPIVVCPQGVTFEAKFEPKEMADWRNEIKSLRVEVERQRTRAEAAENKLSALSRQTQAAAKEAEAIIA